MPSKLKDVQEFFERIATLEAKVEGLMTYQKWQVSLLIAIIAVLIGNYLHK